MNRLPFVLPDFTRVSWNDVNTRNLWEPHFNKIKEAWNNVELHRESSLQFCIPELLPDLALKANTLDKIVVPLEKTGKGDSYSSTSAAIKNGRFQYRVAITNADKVSDWLEAWGRMDNGAIGHLLGYPSCCIDFFIKYWIEEQFVDTSWVMTLSHLIAGDGSIICGEKKKHTLNHVYPGNNILLRWLGLRLVSHLPCSHYCVETTKIAKENEEIFKKLGYDEELSWLTELLSY